MYLRDYLRVLGRRWLTVSIVAALAFAATATLVMTPKYTATTRLCFAVEGTGSAAELAQDSSFRRAADDVLCGGGHISTRAGSRHQET